MRRTQRKRSESIVTPWIFCALLASISAQSVSNEVRSSVICSPQQSVDSNPLCIERETKSRQLYESITFQEKQLPMDTSLQKWHFSGLKWINTFILAIMSYKVPASTVSTILASSLVEMSYGAWIQSSTQYPYGPFSMMYFGLYDDKAWMIGGHPDIGNDPAHDTNVVSFDFKTKSYTKHESLPAGSYVQQWGTEGTQYGNVLYFITPAPLMLNEHWISTYDLSTKSYNRKAIEYKPTGSAPTWQSPCLVTHGQLLYILGGFDNVARDCVNSLSVYDIGKTQWSQGPSLPLKMTHFTCHMVTIPIIGDKLYIIGGAGSANGCTASTSKVSGSIYSVKASPLSSTSKWELFIDSAGKNKLSVPRYMHSSAVVGQDEDNILVIGGAVSLWDGTGYSLTKSTELVKTNPKQILTVDPLETAVARTHAAGVYGNFVYLFGGITSAFPGGYTRSDKYQYLPTYNECLGNDRNCALRATTYGVNQLKCVRDNIDYYSDNRVIPACSLPLTAHCTAACFVPNECSSTDTENCKLKVVSKDSVDPKISVYTCIYAGHMPSCSVPLTTHCNKPCKQYYSECPSTDLYGCIPKNWKEDIYTLNIMVCKTGYKTACSLPLTKSCTVNCVANAAVKVGAIYDNYNNQLQDPFRFMFVVAVFVPILVVFVIFGVFICCLTGRKQSYGIMEK